jgi:hypothetical protein
MNKREWLVSQGLAEGTRGRFSREAEAAWTAHLIEQGNDELIPEDSEVPDLPRDGFHLATLPPVYKVIREQESAYTVDEAGHLIGHSTCGDCKRQVRNCECDGGPWGLSYITPRQKAYLVTA